MVSDTEPIEAVAQLVNEAGVQGRRLRRVIALLSEAPQSLAALVRVTAVPRRSVEAVLRAMKPDLDELPNGFRLRSTRIAEYRERFGYEQLRATELDDPVGRRLAAAADLVGLVHRQIAAAPTAKEALDHVSATSETAVRRALWLDGTFDLAGRRLLCVGDHDLTSLAACAVNPELSVLVVDVDERILEFIDTEATKAGYDVRCLYGDFRFGLPDDAREWADVVFTDPPYTPEGVQLFLGRGLAGLRDRVNGRLVMAYGFSDRAPALGVKVQQAVQDLDLAYEAILPGFNRYHGAQAVGSASDLYVCRATARTWQVLDRKLDKAVVNIYTHGEQSLEGKARVLDTAVAAAVTRIAGTEQGPNLVIGQAWPAGPDNAVRVGLADAIAGGVTARNSVVAVADLSDDPGPWLARLLLAINADRLAVLVPNNHVDITNAAAQHGLSELVGRKYALRFHRSTPSGQHAVVEAAAVDPANLDDGQRLARQLLTRAHGKIANIWRESLVRSGNPPLTKNEARAVIQDAARRPAALSARLIDLPRYEIAELLEDVAASVHRHADRG